MVPSKPGPVSATETAHSWSHQLKISTGHLQTKKKNPVIPASVAEPGVESWALGASAHPRNTDASALNIIKSHGHTRLL